MQRSYPKPAHEVLVQEGLERPPLRWSIQGQMEANRQREAAMKPASQDPEALRRDFDQVKKALLASHLDLQSKNAARSD